ncbi:MAG: PepSY-associated TM helix domain-containing protein, partial [Aeromonas sobria]
MSSKSARPYHVPRWVRPLHTYSSMLMLVIMLFFTVTGLTLNNRQWLPAASPLVHQRLVLPAQW